MRNLKKGQHIFIAFQDGKAVLDSQLRPRIYTSLENADKWTPTVDKGKIEYVEYAPTLTPQNEQLTIEQLREMDGDKINIHYIGACAGFYENETAPYYGNHEQYIQRYNGMLRACDLPLKYYGTQWIATLYRRPPERQEDYHG